MLRLVCATALVVAAAGGTGAAPPVDPVAAQFGAREAVRAMSLSPDGARLAYITPIADGGDVVMVASTDGGVMTPVLRSTGGGDSLTDCHWASVGRLVCGIYVVLNEGDKVGYTRLIAVDADGGNVKEMSAYSAAAAAATDAFGGAVIDWTGSGKAGSVLMERDYVAQADTGTMMARRTGGRGVDLVDTATLARKTVEQPRPGALGFISDGRGTVRIMATVERSDEGMMGSHVRYSYRRPGERDWQLLSTVTQQAAGVSTGFTPYAVDPDQNVAYGFDAEGPNAALYKVSLDGSLKRELVLAQPSIDVDSLVQIGRQNRVVGASFATERRQTMFFDPELKKLAASLRRALPGGPQIVFVDASADEHKLLLLASSDVDPGRYYLFDRTTKKLAEALPVRPELAQTKLASVSAITFKAADGTEIPAYLTLPPGSSGKGLPAVVMPHGGPGARDEWGFDWLAQFYAAKGYAVLQPNFRGSTGYGEAWFQKNGFQSWRTAIGDVNDGGRYLLSSGIAAPGKLAIVGWSYGGYAALQSAVLDPDLFKAIVAVAPVTDLTALREESRRFTNYNLIDAFIGRGPQLTEGSPAQNAKRITAPVLLFHGALDGNVAVGESRLMAARLRSAGRQVDYVEFKGLDHQLDNAAARTELLARSDAFLRKSLGL